MFNTLIIKNCYILLSFTLVGVFFSLGTIPVNAQDNTKTLVGKVVDQYGNPIKGVRVEIEGAKNSSIETEFDGTFSFNNDPESTLILSHKNFINKSFKLGKVRNSKKEYKIVMTTKPHREDEYISGAFKNYDKNSFIGSQSTVYTEDLDKKLSSTIIPSLIGKVAGLEIYQNRGARIHQSSANTSGSLMGSIPNFGGGVYSDNSEYSLSSRGMSPVVLVDGIERDLYSLDPEAIELVSLQKDALSSMLLGMKSSRGALIITTKNPSKEGSQFSFTGKWGINSSINTPKPLNSYQYSYMLNEALQNDGKEPFYSFDDFEKYRNGSNIYTHPNINWYDEIMKDNALSQSYNINVSGGNKYAQYFVNVGYYSEDGLFNDSDNDYNTNLNFERYLISSKVNIKITDDFSALVTLIGRVEDGNQPGGGGSGYTDLLSTIYSTPNNAYPIKNPNGTWGGNVSFTNNLKSQAINSGYIIDNTRDIIGAINLKYDFNKVVKGLSMRAVGNINSQNRSMTLRTMRAPVYYYVVDENNKEGYTMFGSTSTQTNSFRSITTYQQMYGQFAVDYDRNFGNNKISASISGDTRQVLSNYDFPSIPSNIIESLSYSYSNKYFLQMSMAESYYNRYSPGKRWGAFYAAGLGWDVCQEHFMENVEWINKLKLRGVYGLTGNGISNSGYYSYYQSYSTGLGGYSLGTSQSTGNSTYESSPLANPNITWEKANKLDLGIDVALFNDRLRITYDYYNDKYFDLLQQRGKTISLLGQSYPNENIGKVRRWGNEISVVWQDNIRDLNYYVSANWSLRDSKILFIDEQIQPEDYLYRTGKPQGTVFGLVAEGFFKSQDEISKSPVIDGYSNIRPGDIKYKDMNNDGVINEFDCVAIGGDKPISYVGLEYGLSWKGFDISMLWQGAYNRDIYVSDWTLLEGFQSNNQHYGQAYEIVMGRWTPETSDQAILPRLTAGGNNYNRGNGWNSSFWMKSGNFIRLRNMNLSYSLPQKLVHNYLGDTRVKLFVNGENLFTASACNWVDPEVNFTSYPLQRVISFGVNIKF